MASAQINAGMLRWARERVGLTSAEISQKLKVKVERYDAWEQGEDRPTMRQADSLADLLYVPLGYLYLHEPPEDPVRLPDLRSRARVENGLSANTLSLITDVVAKQAWYRDYLLDQQGAEPLAFVGRFTTEDPPARVAADMRRVLAMNEPAPQGYRARLTALITAAELAGVTVMRSGIVGSNTRRAIDVQELQGFAISDDVAPLVFLNSRDWDAAMLFTLAHELAHIWIGESAIVETALGASYQDQAIERFCNAVAAEYLVPADELNRVWSINSSLDDNISQLRRTFSVSSLVAGIRARELNFITQEEFEVFKAAQYRGWQERVQANARRLEEEGRQGGGDFFASLKARTGDQLTRALVESALNGSTMFRDALDLLGIKKASTFDKFLEHL